METVKKVYVKVTADFTVDGKINPVSLTWEDGRLFDIDKILEIRQAASTKTGGQGIRYSCRIKGKIVHLFNEEGRWFVGVQN